jgi:hypothetical protein
VDFIDAQPLTESSNKLNLFSLMHTREGRGSFHWRFVFWVLLGEQRRGRGRDPETTRGVDRCLLSLALRIEIAVIRGAGQ